MPNSEPLAWAESLFQVAASGATVIALLAASVGAIVQIYLERSKSQSAKLTSADVTKLESSIAQEPKPFETAALANYYNQALSRANISFWFSLIFASIGFGVIVFALLSHSSNDMSGTVVKVVSGTVIDAVSGLFFVQSTSAQRSMQEFFEKLRLDRMNAEAKEMIGEVEDTQRRDQLREQMILKFAGINALVVDPSATPGTN